MERRDRSKIGNERERRGERGDDGVHARSARGFSLRVMFRYTELRVERDRTASYDTWNKVAPVKSRSWDVSLVLAPFAFDIRAVRFHAPRPSCPTGPTTVYYQYNPSSFPFFSPLVCFQRLFRKNETRGWPARLETDSFPVPEVVQ